MIPRKSNWFFAFLAVLAVTVVVLSFHAAWRQDRDRAVLEEKRIVLRGLPLTDLCLVTEASYTRHWSQADRHTAFQDSPMTFEHFPSGALYPPPVSLKESHE